MLDIKSNNKFSIVSIEKYEDYQGAFDEEEQQKNNKRTTKEQQKNTNKNVKNVNNVKKKVSKKEKSNSFDDLIENYTSNSILQDELKNHLKVRKMKKGSLTDRAIELELETLDKLAKQEEQKIKIVQQSIEKGWIGFFELKGNKKELKNVNKDIPDLSNLYEN